MKKHIALSILLVWPVLFTYLLGQGENNTKALLEFSGINSEDFDQKKSGKENFASMNLDPVTPETDTLMNSERLDITSDNSYCEAGGEGYPYITGVSIGLIHNTETGSDGYADYTGMSAYLYAGQKDVELNLTVELYIKWAYIAVWIDWNCDGIFDEITENVVNTYLALEFSHNHTLNVPEDISYGVSRMRIRTHYKDDLHPCGMKSYGEVEDYTIILVDSATCVPPYNQKVKIIENSTAELQWSQDNGFSEWSLLYGPKDFDTATTAPVDVTENPVTISDLEPWTDYEWYVRANCSEEDFSAWTGPSPFSTLNIQIPFSRTYGGSLSEMANTIQQTMDGGYIAAGETWSNDGDVHGKHESTSDNWPDYWVVRLNSIGDTIWTKTLGGASWDVAHSIIQTTEGDFVVAGRSSSYDGDVSGHHGSSDYWIVKLDINGDTIWTKTLGGTKSDKANSIIQAMDGDYVIAGYSCSNDGDVSGNHGDSDCWVVKLDGDGNLVWSKSLGGSGWDGALSIIQTRDGNFLIAGESSSMNGDVLKNQGKTDYWVVKLKSDGEVIWSKNFGGSQDDIARSIIQIPQGQYIVAGTTWSDDGHVHSKHGSSDFWVLKLDKEGDTIWTKTLGKLWADRAFSLAYTIDGGCVVVGYTNYFDIGIGSYYDGWMVKLNNNGEKVWSKRLGGSTYDEIYAVTNTLDGGYIIGGMTYSSDGDIEYNHGIYDLWVIKLLPDLSGIRGWFLDSGQQLGTSGSTAVALGDLDGDGDLDAAITNDGDGQPNKVWLNDGNGNFTDSGLSFGNAVSWGVALGDLDNDGDLDGFIANDGPNKVYLNDGPNTSDNGQNLGNAASRDVAIADLDGDGDLDAAVANNENGQPNKVWLNNGDGTFIAFNMDLGNAISWGLDLGYLDADGDVDGFVANDGPNKVYLNAGTYTSDNGQNLGTASGKCIRLGDMDNDGDLDAVVANDAMGQPNKVWLNDGDGDFTDSGLSFGDNLSMGLALGDIDNDGDLDGFVANNGPNKVYLNDGINTTDNGQFLGNNNSYGVALGDLDGDGDLDAFVANYDGPCKVWLNQTMEYLDDQKSVTLVSPAPLKPVNAESVAEEYFGLQENPKSSYLLENYPDPFSSFTNIRLSLIANGHASLKIFNSQGRLVRILHDGEVLADQEYLFRFDCESCKEGLYILYLQTDDGIAVKEKMMLIR